MPHIPRSTAPTSHSLDLGQLASTYTPQTEAAQPGEKRAVEKVVGLDKLSLRRWHVDPAKVLERMTGKKPEELFGSLVDPEAR